jgi:hypothetical protein
VLVSERRRKHKITLKVLTLDFCKFFISVEEYVAWDASECDIFDQWIKFLWIDTPEQLTLYQEHIDRNK